MNKQELLDKLSLCIKHCEKMGSQDGQAAYYGAYSLAVQLDEPSPREGCEYCENGIDQETTLFQFLPPHKSNNKDIGDTITFEEINFCPACGRPLKTEETK